MNDRRKAIGIDTQLYLEKLGQNHSIKIDLNDFDIRFPRRNPFKKQAYFVDIVKRDDRPHTGYALNEDVQKYTSDIIFNSYYRDILLISGELKLHLILTYHVFHHLKL